MSYSPPKVTVNVVPNPRIINIAGDVRLPAVVGPGPTTVYVTDEAVVRGVGAIDQLSAYPKTGLVVTEIAKRSGLQYTSGSSSNAVDAIPGVNGSLYLPSGSVPVPGSGSIAGYTSNGSGLLTWSQDPANVTLGYVPPSGSTYFVSYNHPATASQYLAQTFSDKNDLTNFYGAEGNVTGCLTIAGSIALENGAPAVITCQVSGSISTQSYRDAIDKLRKKSNIEDILVVFPSGSLPTPTFREDVHTYLFQHTQQMSIQGRWRGMFYGAGSAYYDAGGNVSDGIFDAIGDSSTPQSYIGKAVQYGEADVVLPAPSYIWRYDSHNNRIELDGSYLAVAIAGVHAAQPLRSTPITGFQLIGINMEEEKWDMFQMNNMGANGVCVVQNIGGIITIRDAITTDPTSADTQEISVVSQKRLVERTLEDKLFDIYTNKGKTITPTTTRDVEASVRSILNSLVQQGELYGYGVKDDPSTGETRITAIQNKLEPRQIDVTCSCKYLYPFKFCVVTVSTFV